MLPVLSQPPADAHIAACGLFCTNCGAFDPEEVQGLPSFPGLFQSLPSKAMLSDKGITVWQIAAASPLLVISASARK